MIDNLRVLDSLRNYCDVSKVIAKLSYHLRAGENRLMEAMIAAGADVDQVDLRGGTALQVDIGDKQKILRQTKGFDPITWKQTKIMPPKGCERARIERNGGTFTEVRCTELVALS